MAILIRVFSVAVILVGIPSLRRSAMFIAQNLTPLAPSRATSVDGRTPPLTRPGGIIHRMAINIAPLTERESVQSSAVSSFTAPERPCWRRRGFTGACLLGFKLGLRGEKKKYVYGYLTC